MINQSSRYHSLFIGLRPDIHYWLNVQPEDEDDGQDISRGDNRWKPWQRAETSTKICMSVLNSNLTGCPLTLALNNGNAAEVSE